MYHTLIPLKGVGTAPPAACFFFIKKKHAAPQIEISDVVELSCIQPPGWSLST